MTKLKWRDQVSFVFMCTGVYVCVVTLPPLLLAPIISPCIDDSFHICSAFLWGQEVMRASYARMTRQDFFCAPSIPTLLPTDWLTAFWLRPSLSQLLLSSLLSSLLVPVIWCEWMRTLEGFLQHYFQTSTQILIRGRTKNRRKESGREGSVWSIGMGPQMIRTL